VSEPAVQSVAIREFDVARRRQVSLSAISIPRGQACIVGKEADLAIGVEPPDPGVSRRALAIAASADGWRLTIHNRNGAVVHLWGQAPSWADPGSELVLSWPRIGVRVIGSDRTIEHWVLFESDRYVIAGSVPASRPPGPTRQPPIPRTLTATQAAAVRTVFREFLAWPPISGPLPMPLAAAGNRLGVSATAVSERLVRVQERAHALGLHHQTGVSDPSYVYLLVRHGYIDPPIGSAGGQRNPGRSTDPILNTWTRPLGGIAGRSGDGSGDTRRSQGL